MTITYHPSIRAWQMIDPVPSYIAYHIRNGWESCVLGGSWADALPIEVRSRGLLTRDPTVAARPWHMCDEDAREALVTASGESRGDGDGVSAGVNLGVSLYPFQELGVKLAAESIRARSRALIADEMGLGKSVQALGLIQLLVRESEYASDSRARAGVLIVCPSSLQLMWRRCVKDWLLPQLEGYRVAGVKDHRQDARTIQILSYDQAHKAWRDHLGLVIFDEAHYLKNPKAKRSKVCLFGEGAIARQDGVRVLGLTGTPAPNGAVDLWAMLHLLDPVKWDNRLEFEARFKEMGPGLGLLPRQLDALRGVGIEARLSGMVRRMKRDVLKQLPDKTRQIIEVEGSESQERALWKLWDGEIEDVSRSRDFSDFATIGPVLGRLSGRAITYRREASLAKSKHVIKYLQETLIEDECVVVFCVFRETLDALVTAFGDRAVHIHGGVSPQGRQEAVDSFQEGRNGVRVFVGQVVAAGTGITLTRASRLVFADVDWTPANMEQAEDRVHRIGQARGVQIEYIVSRRSLDAHIIKAIIKKQEGTRAALS